jgi:hypothetical protein
MKGTGFSPYISEHQSTRALAPEGTGSGNSFALHRNLLHNLNREPAFRPVAKPIQDAHFKPVD